MVNISQAAGLQPEMQVTEVEDKPKLSPYAKKGMSYFTKLSPEDEVKFHTWVTTTMIPGDEKGTLKHIPFDPSPTSDYDMRGYWKTNQGKLPDASAVMKNGLHFPDTWKTPYHRSFSRESMYATPDAPHWEGNKLFDKTGKLVWDDSSQEIEK